MARRPRIVGTRERSAAVIAFPEKPLKAGSARRTRTTAAARATGRQDRFPEELPDEVRSGRAGQLPNAHFQSPRSITGRGQVHEIDAGQKEDADRGQGKMRTKVTFPGFGYWTAKFSDAGTEDEYRLKAGNPTPPSTRVRIFGRSPRFSGGGRRSGLPAGSRYTSRIAGTSSRRAGNCARLAYCLGESIIELEMEFRGRSRMTPVTRKSVSFIWTVCPRAGLSPKNFRARLSVRTIEDRSRRAVLGSPARKGNRKFQKTRDRPRPASIPENRFLLGGCSIPSSRSGRGPP